MTGGLNASNLPEAGKCHWLIALFSKFDALSTKLDAFLTPALGCRPFFILTR